MLGIFFYPWYSGKDNPTIKYRHWKDDGHNPPLTWNSKFLPSISGVNTSDPSIRLYDSQDLTILNRQMGLIQNAHINFVIWSWWGQGSFHDATLKKYWTSFQSSTLQHCIYYEKEYLTNVPQDEIISDINYIKEMYMVAPNYLKIDGKPVVFVYNAGNPDSTYQSNLASKWLKVRQETGIYIVLKVFKGWNDSTNKTKSDSWHQYAPSTPYAKHAPYSSYVSPGFFKANEDKPRLARDLTRFESNIKTMAADGLPLHTIQTWNEWTEGTGIEPASINNINHGTQYTSIIKRYF